MVELVRKYERKLVAQRLCLPGQAVLGAIDDEVVWNRPSDEAAVLGEIIGGMAINSIVFVPPREPYFSMIEFMADTCGGALRPEDTETRTFLHDIPVVDDFSAGAILPRLRERKAVIVRGRGIVAHGTVSPEQAFVSCSSVVFSTFVKFFVDYRYGAKTAGARGLIERALDEQEAGLRGFAGRPSCAGPFRDAGEAVRAMSEAGRLTVESGMVDSFFGNVSYRLGDTIYISQTGSSLDELEACIDPCPIGGGSTAAVTASSELSSHRAVYLSTDRLAILHGHPRFSVIMSMICDEDCSLRGSCHVKCNRARFIDDIPVVPGEVGTGPFGIVNTLPPALTGRAAIVWGHGVFATGARDFTDAFESLVGVEKRCMELYREISGIGG